MVGVNGRIRINNDPDLQQPAEKPSSDAPRFEPIAFGDLIQQHPALRPVLIEGLLREGETCNIIASPKVGKSFLAGNLAWSVATGVPFLGRKVQQGRVLILDNELHPETLAARLDHIASGMLLSECDRDQLDVISLRGRYASVGSLGQSIEVEPGQYSMIVLDALYRSLPDGTNENDNAAMMAVYNELDALAARWRAAIVVVHHSSKGDQSGKGVTDVGSGAGSISRAADSHLVIRPHDDGQQCVLEAVCRSFPPVEPVSIRFDWPVWYATTAEPIVKRPGRQDTAAQESADRKAVQEILNLIPGEPKTIQQSTLKAQLGYGANKFNRLTGQLFKQGKIKEVRKRKKGGKKHYVFYFQPKVVPEVIPDVSPDVFSRN
jgi:hypothetical protein